MAPKHVQTVRHLIHRQYSELIARSAGFDGNYGFIISRRNKHSGRLKAAS